MENYKDFYTKDFIDVCQSKNIVSIARNLDSKVFGEKAKSCIENIWKDKTDKEIEQDLYVNIYTNTGPDMKTDYPLIYVLIRAGFIDSVPLNIFEKIDKAYMNDQRFIIVKNGMISNKKESLKEMLLRKRKNSKIYQNKCKEIF